MVVFTPAAEEMGPEKVAALLNDPLAEMSRNAEVHGATINQFVGDGIRISFAAPEGHDQLGWREAPLPSVPEMLHDGRGGKESWMPTKPSSPSEQVQRILRDHDLPTRLLPDAVTEARFDPSSGYLEVRLEAPCEMKRAGIPVRYGETISGRVEPGALGELKGVKAKQGFWVSLSSARVDGDQIAFTAGPVRRRLPRSAFE